MNKDHKCHLSMWNRFTLKIHLKYLSDNLVFAAEMSNVHAPGCCAGPCPQESVSVSFMGRKKKRVSFSILPF